MKSSFKVPKGLGRAFETLIRVNGFYTNCYRPIGIKFSEKTTLVGFPGLEEDMVSLYSNLSKLTYHLDSDKDLFVVEVTVRGRCVSDDLCVNGLEVEKGVYIFSMTSDKEITFSLYLLKSTGIRDAKQNQQLLKDLNVFAFQSRHSIAQNIYFNVEKSIDGSDEETVDFSIEGASKEVLEEALNRSIQQITNILDESIVQQYIEVPLDEKGALLIDGLVNEDETEFKYKTVLNGEEVTLLVKDAE